MGPRLEVSPTPVLAAEAAARHFVTAAGEAVRAHGDFVVALSGGSTPRGLYQLLAAPQFADRVDWPRVQVVWGDERCVPPDHPASNYRMAREALLDRVPIPPANLHRIRGEGDPAESAAEYERVLRGVLRTPLGPPLGPPAARIDLVLLGLGLDGHTASLFPGAAAVHDSPRWVAADHRQTESMWRVTLTPVILNAAEEVAFLVWGSGKATIVRQVLEGTRRPHQLPAQLIEPATGRLRWFLDAAAASRCANNG